MKNIFNKIFTLLVILIILSVESVFAKEDSTYQNKNGVIVSEKEYQFINDFYGDEYFSNMTLDQYKWIEDLNIDTSEVEVKEVKNEDGNSIMPLLESFNDIDKKIKIVKSCSADCIIVLKNQFLSNPTIRSYDVIGARLSGTSLINNSIETKISSSGGTVNSNELVLSNNGFGVSVKLPSSGTNIVVEQKFRVQRKGKVFGSYQHAKKNTSLENSKMYSINSLGYGSVFLFYGSVAGVYDGMHGVDISL